MTACKVKTNTTTSLTSRKIDVFDMSSLPLNTHEALLQCSTEIEFLRDTGYTETLLSCPSSHARKLTFYQQMIKL